MSNFVNILVPADGLLPWDSIASAGKVMTKVGQAKKSKILIFVVHIGGIVRWKVLKLSHHKALCLQVWLIPLQLAWANRHTNVTSNKGGRYVDFHLPTRVHIYRSWDRDQSPELYEIDVNSWWRHQMETFFALLALCAGNSPVTDEFPSERPVTRSFYIFFNLHMNKQLSKQWTGRWFETPLRSLWRNCNV